VIAMLEICVVPSLLGEALPPELSPSATVCEAAHALVGSAEGAVALVDADGRLAALLTAEAFVRFVAGGGDAEATLAITLANAAADPLAADDSAFDALMLMTLRGASHLPVLTDDGRLIGVVSQQRLLAAAQAALDSCYRRIHGEVFGARYGEG
jgi:CBS domain-containing protein